VLIAGVTTRALAVSAAKAGYRVTAVDAFGDLDLRAVADVIPVRREHGPSPLPAVAAGARVPAEMVAYTSNFENYPGAVARLAQGRRLLGNPPDVLARVRNPIELTRVLRRHGLATPETRATAPVSTSLGEAWLLKPRRSGGGHGIKIWRPNQPVPRGSYLQKQIRGIAGSIVFAADGYRAVVLGFSRQLVGDGRLGAYGFRYCGSILGTPTSRLFPRQEELLERAATLAQVLSHQFRLVGLNGIDFIARGGVPYLIEVNPRYSASMELVERAHNVSMFQLHLVACCGVLPLLPAPAARVEGKAIVFARRDVALGDTRHWIRHPGFADVPHPGESIRRGHPICTVFAQASDEKTCRRLLIRRAVAVHRFADTRKRRAA
jgi:predicted ATP-grasp superfamily ATP-dependent carboligase